MKRLEPEELLRNYILETRTNTAFYLGGGRTEKILTKKGQDRRPRKKRAKRKKGETYER